jgi:hypothetical protein
MPLYFPLSQPFDWTERANIDRYSVHQQSPGEQYTMVEALFSLLFTQKTEDLNPDWIWCSRAPLVAMPPAITWHHQPSTSATQRVPTAARLRYWAVSQHYRPALDCVAHYSDFLLCTSSSLYIFFFRFPIHRHKETLSIIIMHPVAFRFPCT